MAGFDDWEFSDYTGLVGRDRPADDIDDGTLHRWSSPRPGATGRDEGPPSLTDPFSPLYGDMGPQFDSGAGAMEQLMSLVKGLGLATCWEELHTEASTILGPQSYGLGVCFGMAENVVGSVVGLLKLEKMFVLADVYDVLHGNSSWWQRPTSWVGAVIPGFNGMMGAVSTLYKMGVLPEDDLKKAHDQREALKEELTRLMKDPIGILNSMGVKLKEGYEKKWNEYWELLARPDAVSQFKAGRIFGDVLMDIINAILVIYTAGQAVARLAKGFARLAEVVSTLKGAGAVEALGEGTGVAEATANAAKVKNPARVGEGVPEEPVLTPEEAALREQPAPEAVITGEPVNAITGEVIVEKRDFTLPGRIPLAWSRYYGSKKRRFGACGHGWRTPADARLSMKKNGMIVFNDGSPKGSVFASLPGDTPVREVMGGALLSREDGLLLVRMKSGLTYHFAAPAGEFTEVPASLITDGSGNWVRFSRTSEGLSQILASSGESIHVQSRDGLIRTMELQPKDGPSRLLVRYEYNEEDDLTAVHDPSGKSLRYSYAHHRMIGHTDRNGLTFHYFYDSKGRCVHTRGDGGLYEYRFTYHEGARKTSATDGAGNTWLLRHDENNLLLGKTDPFGHETCYEYNRSHLVSAVVDPQGRRTEYDYDSSGNVTAIRRPEGMRIEVAYNGSNRPVQITDPGGHVWKQEWNERGLLVKRTSPKGAETLYEYDEFGGLVGVTDPLGAKTQFELDPSGAPLGITDALGNRTAFTLDTLGNVLGITDPAGARTSYEYDAKSRLTKVIRPTGAEVTCEYDAEGNLTLYRDEAGRETRLDYTGIGEVSRRVNPDGTTVQYRYDEEERLIEVVNERGETTRLNRDAAGRVIEQIDYWGRPTRYLWDASGGLKESVDALGRTTRYEYDPLDRLIKKIFSDGTAEKFTYDPNGNLILHENGAARVGRLFDEEGRLIEEREGDFAIRNEYDLRGNRIARKTSHGNEVAYAFDAVGRLSGIGINGGSVSAIKRNALGLPVRESLSDTVWREYAYDIEGRLTRQALYGAEAEIRSDYEYDSVGNLVAKRDANHGNTFFTYDPRGRITRHVDPEGRIKEYLYDPAGDLLKLKAEQKSSAITEEDSTYRFDALGNLVKRGSQVFTWDQAGRLKSARHEDGPVTRMSYDALGRRTAKETNGRKTLFTWDGDRLLSDCIHGESPREFVYYPGTFRPFAMIEGDGRICYYNNDVVGLPQEVCDETGNILWSAKYDAFGKVEKVTAPNGFDNPLRLQGQYHDPELNLHYNRYRYFDPDSCSFISKDPLGLAAGVNLYSYAPNVWGWVDPLGLCPKDTGKKITVDLGGEGQMPGAINQQGAWALEPGWKSSRTGQTLGELTDEGHQFVIGDNTNLPFKDSSVDEVITNSVPIDTDTWLGPGVKSSEIQRILKPDGKWINNNEVMQ